MAPRVSVIMATHNHARFVAQAIRSVLDQTFAGFEFLIVDDASTDETARIAEQFDDPRIIFWRGADILGSAARRNELIARAQGDYIALQNSDDVWPPAKLAQQFAFLEANPGYGVTFGRASYIDANGAPLWAAKPTQFDLDNRSPGRWLRHFFESPNNPFCHPTIMLRRSCHAEVGVYDIRLRHNPDVDMFVRLLKRYRVHVSDNVLVSLRWHGGNVSSTHPPGARARLYNEHHLVMRAFFDDMPKDLLIEGFGDLMVFRDPPTDEHRDIEKALICLKAECLYSPVYRVIGLQRLYDLFASPRHRPLLIRDYGLDRAANQLLSGEIDTLLRALDAPAIDEHRRSAEARIGELERAAAERDTALAQAAARIAALEQSAASLHAQLEQLHFKNGTLSGEIADRDRRIDSLLASTSWRVTAPLRLAGRMMGRGR